MLNLISKITSLFSALPTKKVSLPPVQVTQAPEPSKEVFEKNRVGFTAKPKSPPSTPFAQSTVAPEPIVQTIIKQVPVVDEKFTQEAVAAATKDLENIYQSRLSILTEKEKLLFEKEKQLDEQNKLTKQKQDQLDEVVKKQLEKLEIIAGMDVEKARQLVISATEKKMAPWIAKKVEEAREAIKSQTDEASKEFILDAISHGFTDYVAEYTVSSFVLPNEEVKGKIIGREGKNIRAFEKAAGVELELEDGNEIRISSFDSTRREIARLSLEKLIKDGRIQPVRIDEVVRQTRGDMDKILLNEGKKICAECGVFNIPVELMKIVGKYKFRHSYGQNLAKHTIEAVKIGVKLAAELKADVTTVRLGILLHDIGKVITDKEGTHVELGVDLLRQYHFPEAVIACVAEHHEDKPFSSKESIIVYLGDAASGSRPGARYEAGVEHIKRMENIEKTAMSFAGVTSVTAYQAGREVMVIVDPGQVDDNQMLLLAQKVAERLDEEAKWAGSIKVTVVRENRASATVIGNKSNKSAEKEAN